MLKSTTEEYQWHNELKEALQQIHDVGQAIDDATRRASAHLALFNIQETVHHCPVRHAPPRLLGSPSQRTRPTPLSLSG